MQTREDRLTQLRSRAEAALTQVVTTSTNQDIDEVAHELNVYHAELEIQLEDLQQAYQELEVARQGYASLFDFAPFGYIVTDEQGIVINANRTLCSMLGVEKHRLEKRAFAEFITTESQDTYHVHRRTVLQTRHAQTCEVILRHTGGTVFYAQLSTDLPDTLSNTPRTAITNISVLKRTEEALQRALAYEKEVSGLRTRVLHVIAHEFRTPLSIILASADLIDRSGDLLTEEKLHHYCQSIRDVVWYLNDTIQDGVSISTLDGQPELKLESFDIAAFTHLIVDEMKPLTKKGQDIILVIQSPDDVEMVTWDRMYIRRVLLNLLKNAIKYSTQAVHCTIVCKADSVQIMVRDQGSGISEQDQKHMYEPFFRGANAAFIPGTGIGLYVVQRAVHAHGGTIRCMTQQGEGSLFTVELPRHAVDLSTHLQ